MRAATNAKMATILITEKRVLISYPFCKKKLQSGRTLAPTLKFSMNFMLSIRPRRLSGMYLESTTSFIGICPKTKNIAMIIVKNKAQSENNEVKKMKTIWPVAMQIKTILGENLSNINSEQPEAIMLRILKLIAYE